MSPLSKFLRQFIPIPVVPNQRLECYSPLMRKRHVQQSLFRRGGKRRGAGRKPKGRRANERHAARPHFKPYHPLHIVMRVAPSVGSLRRRKLYKAMRDATITAALREYFRIVHISLQRDHVHLLVEAEDKAALARGMQGFTISAARHVNTALGDGKHRRRGNVFADRYHVKVITTPTQARHALRYVHVQLAQARRGPRGPREHVARRPVLQRDLIPRLGGAGRSAVDVADPRDVRSADRAETAELVAHGGRSSRPTSR
jgi:REP element-mobilizing transposase RayT